MLTVALVTLFVACAVVAWLRGRSAKNEPPVLPGAWPLVGHAHLLLGDTKHLWNFFKQMSYESLKAGGILSVHIGPSTVYMVTDPDDCLKIGNDCLQKDRIYEFGKPWLGDGLLTSDVTTWKKHRALLNKSFNQTILNGFLGVFNRQARRLVKDLEAEVGKGPFDHWVYIRDNALETICLTALGVDISEKNKLNSQYVNAVEQILKTLAARIQRVWLHNQFLFNWSSLKKQQDECVKILHHMSSSVLNKRKADFMKNRSEEDAEENSKGPQFKPFMDLLLELSVEEGVFNDQEIRDHVETMIVAGHETSASVNMFTMLLVGSYPQVQQKIVEELHDVFGDEDRDVTTQDISRLVYLEAVIKESIRICPIVPFVARIIDRDLQLRNCTLRKGRRCFMLFHGVHRHPMWGPDAEEFRPERWLDPATLPECPHAFAGFSVGRRNCIGKSYAYMSMKTTLAHVFRHYRVSGDHTKLVAKIDVLLKPVSGHYITIEKRKITDDFKQKYKK